MDQANKPKDNFQVTFDFVKTPITQIADYIIIAASKHNASDIHFDPRENGMMVRFRIDGDLQDYSFIPKAYERNLTTRLKLLANMNITESRLPQDGAIKGTFGDIYLDMRVSCLPLNEGEKIVIRILDYTRSLQGIDSLGFHPNNLAKLKRMMEAPNGIILVTGATGSGKSTTTYSILQGLNTPETNIITVEDPIEMNIQGINQVQVNSEIGMTFAAALRSILRQDPNVILIGEIRDSETAQIAVRSAITGHLVLSTIHTNNSLSTIERLMDMDVERYLLSTALVGIISQRLAKKICPQCRFQRKTTPYEQKIFRTFLKLDVQTVWDANPDGCPECRKGYKGRIAIQEVLELDDEIRAALTIEGLTKDELRKMVYTDKTITMLQDALLKCLDGLTSFEEVYRVIEMENDDDQGYKSELTAAIKEARSPESAQAENVTYNSYNVNINTDSNNNATTPTEQATEPAPVIQPEVAQTISQLPNIINNLQNVSTTDNQPSTTVDNQPPTVTDNSNNQSMEPSQEGNVAQSSQEEVPTVVQDTTNDTAIPTINTSAPENDAAIPVIDNSTLPETNTDTVSEISTSDNSNVEVPLSNEVVEIPQGDATSNVENNIAPDTNAPVAISPEDIRSTLNLAEEQHIPTTTEQDDGSIITDDMLKADVLIGDDGVVEQDEDAYSLYDFKNNKTLKLGEDGNMVEVADENTPPNPPSQVDDSTTSNDVISIVENNDLPNEEDKRKPIGADFVDQNGPLLEQLPRLGTEIEVDLDDNDNDNNEVNSIIIPNFTE